MTGAGLLESLPGARGGYRLARHADAITFPDVVLAIDGAEPAFRCKNIRQCGPVVSSDADYYRKPCAIYVAMARAEGAWRAELRAVRLIDMLDQLATTLPNDAKEKATAWFGERMRA